MDFSAIWILLFVKSFFLWKSFIFERFYLIISYTQFMLHVVVSFIQVSKHKKNLEQVKSTFYLLHISLVAQFFI
jgi:hypothetical protein